VFWSYQGQPGTVNYSAISAPIDQFLGSGFSSLHDPFWYDPFGSSTDSYSDPFHDNTSSPWGSGSWW
jgi:hypothetical protein